MKKCTFGRFLSYYCHIREINFALPNITRSVLYLKHLRSSQWNTIT